MKTKVEKPTIYGGYWYDKSSKEGKKLPKPLAADEPFFDKTYLVKRIKSLQTQAYFGKTKSTFKCKFCYYTNSINGQYTLENKFGTVIWQSGLLHYMRKHNVRPTQEFVAAITPYELPPKVENKPAKVEDEPKKRGRPKKISKPHIDQVFAAFQNFQNETIKAVTKPKAFKAAQDKFKNTLDILGLYDHIDWTQK